MSRVQWLPPAGSFGTMISALILRAQIAVAVGEAHDGIGIGHVDPVRIVADSG